MLNNRETAWAVWLSIFIVVILCKKDLRRSFSRVIKSAFAWKLSLLYTIILLYTSGFVYLIWKNGLWDSSQLKNTLFWLFTVPVISLFDAHKSRKANNLSKALKDVFAFTAILQFLVGVYTFSLLVEVLLVPLVIILAGTLAVADTRVEYMPVKKFLFSILSLFGFFLIGYTIYSIWTDYKSFVNQGTLNDFLIPAVLTFSYLPLLYTLSIYVYYEDTFTLLSRKVKNPSLRRYIVWKALVTFGLQKSDLEEWKSYLLQQKISTRSQVNETIKFLQDQKKLEKKPVNVPSEKGWSPYTAKNFLASKSVSTGLYKPVFEDEWHACSPYIKLDNSFLANNIAYYISGNKNEATSLKLVANIHNPGLSTEAISMFLQYAQVLYENAIKQKWNSEWSDEVILCKNFIVVDEYIELHFRKTNWLNVNNSGFSLIYEILHRSQLTNSSN